MATAATERDSLSAYGEARSTVVCLGMNERVLVGYAASRGLPVRVASSD